MTDAVAGLSFKELQSAIKNVNVVLALEPKLSPIGKPEVLKDRLIKTLSPLADAQDDRLGSLAAETITTYNAICAEVAPPAPEPTAVAAETQAPAPAETAPTTTAAPAPEAYAPGSEPVAPPLTPAPAAACTCPSYGKTPDQADPVCIACSWLVPCTDLVSAGASATKASKKKAAPKVKVEKFGRVNAFCNVLMENKGKAMAKEDLIMAMDREYVKHGGTSNLKESGWCFGVSIKPLTIMGHATQEGDQFTYL